MVCICNLFESALKKNTPQIIENYITKIEAANIPHYLYCYFVHFYTLFLYRVILKVYLTMTKNKKNQFFQIQTVFNTR